MTNTFDAFHGKYDAGKTPVALHISKRVLTLPLYADLRPEEAAQIADLVIHCKK